MGLGECGWSGGQPRCYAPAGRVRRSQCDQFRSSCEHRRNRRCCDGQERDRNGDWDDSRGSASAAAGTARSRLLPAVLLPTGTAAAGPPPRTAPRLTGSMARLHPERNWRTEHWPHLPVLPFSARTAAASQLRLFLSKDLRPWELGRGVCASLDCVAAGPEQRLPRQRRSELLR